MKCPFSQRLRLSSPTNQSGDGTNFEIMETWKELIKICCWLEMKENRQLRDLASIGYGKEPYNEKKILCKQVQMAMINNPIAK